MRDVPAGTDRLIADPRTLLGDGEEICRRRSGRAASGARQAAAGVVGVRDRRGGDGRGVRALRPAVRRRPEDRHGAVRELVVPGPVLDPAPDPTGVAHRVRDRRRAAHPGRRRRRRPARWPAGGPRVTYGLAEFVAAEEMDRMRGYWWSPDGAAAPGRAGRRSPVQRWYIADPANPDRPADRVALPRGRHRQRRRQLSSSPGSDGTLQPVDWDPSTIRTWSTRLGRARPAAAIVQTRDQRTMRVLDVDPATGSVDDRAQDTDPRLGRHRPRARRPDLPTAAGPGPPPRRRPPPDHRRRAGHPGHLQVREILDVGGETVLLHGASGGARPRSHVWACRPGRSTRVSRPSAASTAAAPRAARWSSPVQTLAARARCTRVRHNGTPRGHIDSHAERPMLDPRVTLISAGRARPGHRRAAAPRARARLGQLPVLMRPLRRPARPAGAGRGRSAT